MTPEHWAAIRALLAQAMELEPSQRSTFLAACDADPAIVSEAERLLAFEHQASAMFSIETWQGRSERTAAERDLSGIVIGSYRLVHELGRGGMGAVYLAERDDGTYQQKVAVKILQENIFTAALTARFRQERQILARLTHPGIARLLDGGVLPDGRPYLVLEFVDGLPIDRYAIEQNLSLEDRLRLFIRVAEVVQSAHQQLVLHLDLKPANILVTPEGEPRLLDFGLARILSDVDKDTEATLRLLTPRYASPEQASGAPLGVASDVFSLATLLYRLLTGVLPYPIEDVTPLVALRILNDTAPTIPSLVVPALKGDVDTILLQGLRKEPERRYPTVAALAEDVARHLASKPVLAHADSLHYRAGKFFRRNRVQVIAAAATMSILVASAVAVVHSAAVARRQRGEAELQRAKAVQRFNDLRSIAHSYLFDIDAQLEPIPGTIKVREFVMHKGLTYLDAMSHEAEGDDDLTREVGQAYSQIAFVQADSSMPSLNNRQGALESARKAEAMQQRLFEKNPSMTERMQLLRQMRVLEQQTLTSGDPAAAVAIIDSAWKIGQPVIAVGPGAPRFMYIPWLAIDRVSALIGNGDEWNLADPVSAESWLNLSNDLVARTINIHPELADTTNFTTTLSNLAYFRAKLLRQLGRDAEAQPYLREALRAAQRGPESTDRQQSERVLRLELADWLLRHGSTAEAKSIARSILPRHVPKVEVDRLLTSEDAAIEMLLARIALREGRLQVAQRGMEHGLKTQKALYDADMEEINISSSYAYSLFNFAEMSGLPAARRVTLYRQAEDVAAHYAATHPNVLSPVMLQGKCELGLAQLAGAAHRSVEAHVHADLAIGPFRRILKARPVQPEASTLLGRAIQARTL